MNLGSVFLIAISVAGLLAGGAPADGGAAALELPAGGGDLGRLVAEPQAVGDGSLALRGPVDPETYVIGPGDRLSVTLWGRGVVTYAETVTPEGDLMLPGIAPIRAAGRTLALLKQDVAGRLAGLYHGMEIAVSLTELRKIEVSVLGAVDAPGAYTASALDLAGEIIKRAGGLVANASERNIEIIRPDGSARRVDLVRYRNTGDLDANPPILDGDVVFVPFVTENVYIYGAVPRPGGYELAEGETIGSLLSIAGGFARGAVSETVEVRKFVDDAATEPIVVDMLEPGGAEYPLADGDQVYVQRRNDWRLVRIVSVEGEMAFPGIYGINEGTDRLSDVLRRAGGPTAEASLGAARLTRAVQPDEADREFERLKGIPSSDMTESEYAYFKAKSVEIAGMVETDFEKALSGDPSADALLRDGDRIVVPRNARTVTVSGRVAHPGEIAHVPGKVASYCIRESGGYASQAKRGHVRVVRWATGQWLTPQEAGHLIAGDEVWVPERPETDWWAAARDIASFAASLATTYLLIQQATK